MEEKRVKEGPQRIIRLAAENVLRLRAVRIHANGKPVRITGKNDQGKTSVLKLIAMALGGKDAVPEKPIRDGADGGRILLETEDFVVERRFTEKDSYLSVTAKPEGGDIKSPQAMLDRLLGRDGRKPVVAFDPAEYGRFPAAEQRRVLLGLVDLGIDLDEWEKEERALADTRKLANQRYRDAEGELRGLEPVPDDAPPKRIDVDELLEQIKLIAEHNQFAADRDRAYDKAVDEHDRITAEIESLQDKLRDLVTAQSMAVEKIAECRAEIPERMDDGELQAKLKDSQRLNRAHMLLERRDEAEKKVDLMREKARTAEEAIAEHRAKRDAAMEGAEMPVDGLAITADGVTMDGIPLEQLSDSKRLWVSMHIAMALNPGLRVLLVDRAELLDGDNMKVLEEEAAAYGFQLWTTVVADEAGPVGVHILDGEVAAIDGVEVER
jgi:hypothetical protein